MLLQYNIIVLKEEKIFWKEDLNDESKKGKPTEPMNTKRDVLKKARIEKIIAIDKGLNEF